MKETILKTAEFNPKVRTYWLLSGAFVLTATIVGIPLLLLWFPIGLFFTQRYLDKMSCVLTDRSLKLSKGVLNRIEKTVPLDKITDMALKQGPIMRFLDIEGLSVETAGQSGPGSLVTVVGVRDARSFRDLVLKQRDLVTAGVSSATVGGAGLEPVATENILSDIRDTLIRIEDHLTKST